MEDVYTSTGEPNNGEKPKLPSALNALTILTFIGCGLGLLWSLFLPVFNKFMLGMMEKAKASGSEMSSKQLEDMEKGRAVMELAQANLVPLMVIGLIGIALCIWGAVWMRKRRKDGFWIYTAGEIMPVIGSFIIMGTAQFTGAFSVILAVGLPIIFVILYALQLKHLTK
ncbi:MAG: hypothetical protein ABIQ31_24255 [Ferruginibacter sp.]